jgi:uncharacterized protein (TIGR02996 family)
VSTAVADENGLVRAILIDPWDRLARSAYADWLEEQGKPLHAELQRLHGTETVRRWELVAAIGKPFARYAYGGTGSPRPGADGLLELHMTRQSFTAAAFQEKAAACIRDNHIARITLEGGTSDWSKVGNAPALEHLRALGLGHCELRDDGAKVLARSRGMGRLFSLGLAGSRMLQAGLAEFARSTAMPNLGHLDLSGCQVGQNTLRALADGPMAGQLQHLGLACGIGDVGLAILLRRPALLRPVVTLHLRNCRLTEPGVMQLAASEHLENLRVLSIGWASMSEPALAHLVDSALFRRLRRLNLSSLGGHPGPGFSLVVRAAADQSGLTLVLNQYLRADVAAAYRELLGDRLVLE